MKNTAVLFTVCFFSLVFAPLASGQESEAPMELKYRSQDSRDPFEPLIGKGVAIKNVKYLDSVKDAHVEGIIMDSNAESVAMINGQLLKEGDFIGGFKVEKIYEDQVVLSRDGENHDVFYGQTTSEE